MKQPLKILFKYPSRSRPERFLKGLLSISTQCRNDYTVLVSLDKDDPTLPEYQKVLRHSSNCQIIIGESQSKIHAVNRDLDLLDIQHWDILVCMSDDAEFLVPGFDQIISEDMQTYFPDLDGVLHYNDGAQKGNCMTLSVMGRKYADRFRYLEKDREQIYIYHPSYKSLWCDVEATEAAHILGKYAYLGDDKMIHEHQHPALGKAEWDEQYRKTEDPKVWNEDKAVLDARRKRFYDIPASERVNGYKYPATL